MICLFVQSRHFKLATLYYPEQKAEEKTRINKFSRKKISWINRAKYNLNNNTH
jgi:hypothetical protein